MRAQLRRELFPAPIDAPQVKLTADHMAEALLRASMATGELSQLAYRYEAAVRGHCTLRARWIALAALLSLHQTAEIQAIAAPLGCGFNPLRVLASCRRTAWWDEALVHRLQLDLADRAGAPDLASFDDLRRAISDVLADKLNQSEKRGPA